MIPSAVAAGVVAAAAGVAEQSEVVRSAEGQGCHFLSAAEVAAEFAAEFVTPAASVARAAPDVSEFVADTAGSTEAVSKIKINPFLTHVLFH